MPAMETCVKFAFYDAEQPAALARTTESSFTPHIFTYSLVCSLH